jgi:hypothetical protein
MCISEWGDTIPGLRATAMSSDNSSGRQIEGAKSGRLAREDWLSATTSTSANVKVKPWRFPSTIYIYIYIPLLAKVAPWLKASETNTSEAGDELLGLNVNSINMVRIHQGRC